MADDYDSPWKDAIELHFADFLHFYFPAAHAKIDWSRPISFLEQELREVVRDAELGKRFVDKLVKVSRHSGQDDWLYIHLEVQGSPQEAFAERMFVYNYRLYDRYRTPIASLAVLADDRVNWRPTEFGYDVLDCQMGIRFPVAKLLDWSGSEARLADSVNPFAIVTRAHLATRATAHDPDARCLAKRTIVRDLFRHNWDKQKVLDLFAVIDWMMRLPKEHEQAFLKTLEATEEDSKMRYVTSIERLAREEGIEQGVRQGILQGKQQGIQQGMQLGLLQGQVRLLAAQLTQRFGEMPAWASDRLAAASEAELEVWAKAVLSAATLGEVFASDQH